MRRHAGFRCILAFPILLAACSQPRSTVPPSAPSPPETKAPASVPPPARSTNVADAQTLARHHWVLERAEDAGGARIEALFARPDAPLQLDFTPDRLAVVNACNRISGGYALEEGRLRVAQLAQTMMACTRPEWTALDEAISSRLRGDPALELREADGVRRLALATDAGDRLVFVGTPTAETRHGGPGERMFLEVAAQTVPCNHPLMPGKRCLEVRERHYDENGLASGTPGEWHVLGQDIEGYAHEAGVRNVLRLKRFGVANPPADAPSVRYVLDMVVESDVGGQ